MKQLTWAYYFLREQRFDMMPSVLYQDNESTTKLIKNGRRSSLSKTKHIHNRSFFIHDKVKKGEIEVRYCDTERMLADGFTEPLQGKKFVYFRNETLNMNIES